MFFLKLFKLEFMFNRSRRVLSVYSGVDFRLSRIMQEQIFYCEVALQIDRNVEQSQERL